MEGFYRFGLMADAAGTVPGTAPLLQAEFESTA